MQKTAAWELGVEAEATGMIFAECERQHANIGSFSCSGNEAHRACSTAHGE